MGGRDVTPRILLGGDCSTPSEVAKARPREGGAGLWSVRSAARDVGQGGGAVDGRAVALPACRLALRAAPEPHGAVGHLHADGDRVGGAARGAGGLPVAALHTVVLGRGARPAAWPDGAIFPGHMGLVMRD